MWNTCRDSWRAAGGIFELAGATGSCAPPSRCLLHRSCCVHRSRNAEQDFDPHRSQLESSSKRCRCMRAGVQGTATPQRWGGVRSLDAQHIWCCSAGQWRACLLGLPRGPGVGPGTAAEGRGKPSSCSQKRSCMACRNPARREQCCGLASEDHAKSQSVGTGGSRSRTPGVPFWGGGSGLV